MASYGRREFWDERYSRNNTPCEWIAGWDVVSRLLTRNFLCYGSAPLTYGEIRVTSLNSWLMSGLGPLLRIKHDVIDEELEYCDSKSMELTVDFPERENARVLNVGCGSSQLPAFMAYHGWLDITNVDYSEVLIEHLKQKYDYHFHDELQSCLERDVMLRHSLGLESRDDSPQALLRTKPNLSFEAADITKGLHHPDESFDLIICKKTLDVILCSAGSVAAARAMMSECFRLLNRDHGVMMILSSGKPEDRAVFFENDPWTGVLNVKLPRHDDAHYQRKSHDRKVVEHYVYVLYKQSAPTE